MSTPGQPIKPEDIPEAWVEAAEAHYSMHGAGLVRNIIAGVAPLIRGGQREQDAQLAEQVGAAYPVTREDTYGGEYEVGASFADLLRQDPAGGETP